MNLINKQKEESINLRKNIRWIIKVRNTYSTREILLYLKSDFGKIVDKRTVQRHLKEIRLIEIQEYVKRDNTAIAEKQKEVKEIKVARKSEKTNTYPYYLTSPCEHKTRIKVTSNPNIQNIGCGNCGCTYDRYKGVWYDRITGSKWGEKSKTAIGHVRQLMFDYD